MFYYSVKMLLLINYRLLGNYQYLQVSANFGALHRTVGVYTSTRESHVVRYTFEISISNQIKE